MSQLPTIILDANAFISGVGLLELGAKHKLVTTPQVMEQLRDPKTREMMDKFVFEIQEIQPDKKSVEFIKEFARKTGDIASLSDVDMELLALTYCLYVKKGLDGKLNKIPPPIKQMKDLQKQQGEESSEYDEDSYSDDQEETKNQNNQNKEVKQESVQGNKKIELTTKQQQTESKKEGEDQDDDGEWNFVPVVKKPKRKQTEDDMDENQGWITPQNFEKKMAEGTITFEAEDDQQQQQESSGISLMTADYAMQNVALQIGMHIKSLDGRKIKQVRRFILECYLCWKQYKIEDNKILLCKECGYNSLSKIAYSVSTNGLILHRKKGWKPNQKVLEWKQRKYEEQQKKKKHQHARRKKGPSIFEA